ncbi:phage tail sheath protein [Escherichia coli]|nr:phage tail sheath protein [Escherichia coli]
MPFRLCRLQLHLRLVFVTLTARHKGLCGNEIPVSLNYYGFGGGEVLPAGVQIAVATGPPERALRFSPARWLQWRMSRLIISVCRSTTTASVNTLVTEMNDTERSLELCASAVWSCVYGKDRHTVRTGERR